MVDAPDARHRRLERARIRQVALRDLHRAALERGAVSPLPREHTHRVAVREKLTNEVGAHESSAAGDERIHGCAA